VGFANVRQGIAISAGTGVAYTGIVIFSNSNNVSFGAQASASSTVVTVSTSGGLGGAIAAISAGTTQASSGQVVFSNANGISWGVNGQTVTAGITQISAITIQDVDWAAATCPGASSAINLSFRRTFVQAPITATRIDLMLSMTNAGSTAGSYTISIAAYTMGGSTASSVSSASAAVTWNSGTNTGAASIYAGQSDMRWQSVAIGTWSVTPGDYLFALNISINGPAGSTPGLTLFGQTQQASLLAPGGGNFSAYFCDGLYSAGTGAFPSSVQLSEIVQTHTANMAQPNFQMAGTF
jgi:hypothetical protein